MSEPVLCRPLRAGGTFGIFSTGAPLDPERFERGVQEIERRGFRWKSPIDPTAWFGTRPLPIVSATLADRTESLLSLLADDEVDVLIAARGGYGTLEILPAIDLSAIAKFRKPIVGYSDISALLVSLSTQTGLPTIHGATVGKELAESASDEEARESVDALFSTLRDPQFRNRIRGEVLRGGEAEGTVVVSNLTMLNSLLGTPWEPDLTDTILCLEDVGEAPYRLRRSIVQLHLAGKLRNLRGLVFGRFSRCEPGQGPTIYNVLQDSLHDLFSECHYPILLSLEFGHNGKNLPLPLGCRAKLSGDALTFLTSPIDSH